MSDRSTPIPFVTLINIGWRYLARHPWQSVLMILGITLGVAVVVAIDLANASSSRAFDLSTEAVTGRATHQIVASAAGLDETLYADLRQQGIDLEAAPVLRMYVSSSQLGEAPLELLGLDLFAEAPFRDYFTYQAGTRDSEIDLTELAAFLTQPGSVLISEGLAQQHGLGVGSEITLQVAGRDSPVRISGLLQPEDALSRRALQTLLIADIATVQELTGRQGVLDAIDLILPEGTAGEQMAEEINSLLPDSVRLIPVAARQGTVDEMTRAFRINLTALSLLALVVGLFLIYNTMTFSVVQRRSLFGTMRCLGFTRREVFLLVVSEALIIGFIGAVLGIVLGILMGQAAVQMVTQTVNDLFFVLSVRGVQVPIESLVKGALLGILATVLTASPPAWEAASVQPRAALSRSGLESKASRAVLTAALAGLVLLIAGILVLNLPTRELVISFVGTFAVIIGFAALAPVVTVGLMRIVLPLLSRMFGTLGRMAPRDVTNSLSRTAIAIAALMVAVSVTIGVSLMVSSFRNTVVLWLEQTLQGDIYISAPGGTSTQISTPIQPGVLSLLENVPEVRQAYTLRSVSVDSPTGPVQVASSSNPGVVGERTYLFLKVDENQLAEELRQGKVLLSEPLYNRLGYTRDTEAITLYTATGPAAFPITGVYYDYSSPQGTLLISQEIYQQHWNDETITAVALLLEDGVDPDSYSTEIQARLSGIQALNVRPNLALRAEVLEVFDRTFAITTALQLLATTVAFVGVLSALLSLELERGRELGILRSIGLTARQIWGLILMETGLMGGAAGLLALPTGYVLAVILIYIINLRSFGWTLQMQVIANPFVWALLISVAAALLAGIYPAWRMSRTTEADAMRME